MGMTFHDDDGGHTFNHGVVFPIASACTTCKSACAAGGDACLQPERAPLDTEPGMLVSPAVWIGGGLSLLVWTALCIAFFA